MASSSSVPKITFTDAGIIIPQVSDILSGVQADIDAAFGGGLNPALETPQGQLASSQAAIISDKNNELAYLVNQIDPQYADGRFQDAIGRIYFLTRKPATYTVVQCTLTGQVGTVIPAGTLAQDTAGNTYACAGTVTIPSTGQVPAEFQNIASGPTPCAAGTLTQVYQAISGWDAITNADAGVLGSDVESRADFEYRRQNSVALNGQGSLPSVYAAVFAIADVVDVYAAENPTGATVTRGVTNYSLSAHSLYIAVVGGTDADIAQAIWSKKDIGCDYNGNTSVEVTDSSGYNYPYPTYQVTFMRPTPIGIKFLVQIASNPNLPYDVVAQVQAAVLARFNGTDGEGRERIGANIYASRYYSAISSVSSRIVILSVLLGTGTPDAIQVMVGIDQVPALTAADITVELV